jgi:methylthioribose-1-phosphate isomerase
VIWTFSGSVFVLSGLKLIQRPNVEVKNANGKKVNGQNVEIINEKGDITPNEQKMNKR